LLCSTIPPFPSPLGFLSHSFCPPYIPACCFAALLNQSAALLLLLVPLRSTPTSCSATLFFLFTRLAPQTTRLRLKHLNKPRADLRSLRSRAPWFSCRGSLWAYLMTPVLLFYVRYNNNLMFLYLYHQIPF
jgi:hypothetical protein